MIRLNVPSLKAAGIALLTLLCGAAPAVHADENPVDTCKAHAGTNPYVCFDHAQRAWVRSVASVPREGAPVDIIIINTEPDHIGVTTKQIPELHGLNPCGKGAKIQTFFPSAAGRYSLEITFDNSCAGLAAVAPTEFKVEVLGWEQALSGAFMGSGHRNPQFSTYTRMVNNQSMTFVDQEPSNSTDEIRLGLGSFIHIYNERAERWAEEGHWIRHLAPSGFSFGLGIGEQNRTTYALGPSWRFSDKAFLTLGYSWAPVDRLPNGVRICPRSAATCDPSFAISDPNRLSTLSQRNKGAWFVGLSYSFLKVGTFFEDQFRKAIQASGSQQQQQQTAQAPKAECQPAKFKAGNEITLTITAQQAGFVRAEMGGQFEDLAPLADWKACTDAKQGNPDRCYEQEVKEAAGKTIVTKFKLTTTVQPGTYHPKVSEAGIVADPKCDFVVESGS